MIFYFTNSFIVKTSFEFGPVYLLEKNNLYTNGYFTKSKYINFYLFIKENGIVLSHLRL